MRGGGVRLVGFLFAVDGQKNRRSHLTVVQVPLKRISYLLFSFMWIVQLWAVQIAFPFKYNNSFLVLEYWLLCKAVHQFKGVLTHASTVSANTLKELTDRLNYRPCFFFIMLSQSFHSRLQKKLNRVARLKTNGMTKFWIFYRLLPFLVKQQVTPFQDGDPNRQKAVKWESWSAMGKFGPATFGLKGLWYWLRDYRVVWTNQGLGQIRSSVCFKHCTFTVRQIQWSILEISDKCVENSENTWSDYCFCIHFTPVEWSKPSGSSAKLKNELNLFSVSDARFATIWQLDVLRSTPNKSQTNRE